MRTAASSTRAGIRLLPVVIGAAALAAAVVAAALVIGRGSAAPDDNDATVVHSSRGLYELAVSPPPEAAPVNRLHSWQLELRRDGDPVEGASIHVDGDMPAHGHGLPTQPVVRELGDGRYEVEGMKFQMGGAWYVAFDITSEAGTDSARVDFVLH